MNSKLGERDVSLAVVLKQSCCEDLDASLHCKEMLAQFRFCPANSTPYQAAASATIISMQTHEIAPDQ
jgi:hypothetical protein